MNDQINQILRASGILKQPDPFMEQLRAVVGSYPKSDPAPTSNTEKWLQWAQRERNRQLLESLSYNESFRGRVSQVLPKEAVDYAYDFGGSVKDLFSLIQELLGSKGRKETGDTIKFIRGQSQGTYGSREEKAIREAESY